MFNNMMRCNECGKDHCNDYENVRKIYGCPNYVGLSEFKTPLLVHLMEGRKAQNTMLVLKEAGFEIDEIGTYPYFRLYPKKMGK